MVKRLYLLLYVGIIQLSGQNPYYRMLKTDTIVWQHFDCIIPVLQKQNSLMGATTFAALDTITIGGLKYKKIYNLNTTGISYSFKSLEGYIREDSIARKVYYKTGANPEKLLYDFSKSAGDSIYLEIPFNPSETGYYRLDSVVTRNERCGPRRHFYYRKHLNNPNQATRYMDHIESIGSSYHAFYPWNYLSSGCQLNFVNNNSCKWPDWALGLSCKYNNLKKQYQSCTFVLAQMVNCINKLDSCNYHNYCSNLKSLSRDAGFSISPGPADTHLMLRNDNPSATFSFRIQDVSGKILLSGSQELKQNEEMQIETQNLRDGIYFLYITCGNDFTVKQFAVSH